MTEKINVGSAPFVTIDPGVKRLYCARFEQGQIVAFGDIDVWRGGCRFVVEYPRLNKGHPRPQDIVDLAYMLGEVRAYERAGHPVLKCRPSEWKGQQKKPTHHLRIWNAMTLHERFRIVELTKFQSLNECESYILSACDRLARTGKVTGYSFEAHNYFDTAGLGFKHLGRI